MRDHNQAVDDAAGMLSNNTVAKATDTNTTTVVFSPLAVFKSSVFVLIIAFVFDVEAEAGAEVGITHVPELRVYPDLHVVQVAELDQACQFASFQITIDRVTSFCILLETPLTVEAK